jgi:hypothetical protein
MTVVPVGRALANCAEKLDSAQKDIKTSTMLKQAKTKKASLRPLAV